MIRAVVLSARARKDLRQCPAQVVRKLMAWVGSVQEDGVVEFARVDAVNKHEY